MWTPEKAASAMVELVVVAVLGSLDHAHLKAPDLLTEVPTWRAWVAWRFRYGQWGSPDADGVEAVSSKEPRTMLTQGEDVGANALYKRGWSISAIARHLGRDRKTIRAYVNEKRQPGKCQLAGPDVRTVGGLRAQQAWGVPTTSPSLLTTAHRPTFRWPWSGEASTSGWRPHMACGPA